ncbi:hypothetical protein XM38_039620 [Halomicronema hongdechloris C2206]|uniref:Uncharacterized protein n=1 Tax=Halomicronema hongdechloris C2206 TaxID=1641165 RepID=A0A1Z3HRQ2_9CYAN|nr:hypothetical protein XM38_039620 [Halomicronema hongdechloris C2206]
MIVPKGSSQSRPASQEPQLPQGTPWWLKLTWAGLLACLWLLLSAGPALGQWQGPS